MSYHKKNKLTFLTGDRNSTDQCKWTGISCDTRLNVVSIDLTGLQIAGVFPSEFCRIPTLRNLNLAANHITGQISPASISSCFGLVYLNLSNNLFVGNLPDIPVPFSTLTTLDLSANNFSGEIPFGFSVNLHAISFPSCINMLSNLQDLHVQGNNFTGGIPKNISALANLAQLDFSGNRFSGIIPDNLGSLPMLTCFNLSNNMLDGEIPTELTNLKLTLFDVSNNQLVGQVPAGFDTKSFVSGLIGNPGLCSTVDLEPLRPCSTPKQTHERVSFSLLMVILPCVALIAIIVIVLLVMKNKKFIGFGRKHTQTWKVTTFHKVALDEEDVLSSLDI